MDADTVFQFSVTPKRGAVESRNLKKLLILVGVLCFVLALTVEMMHSYAFVGIKPIEVYVRPIWIFYLMDAVYAIACLGLIAWTWVAYDRVRNWELPWLERHLAMVGGTFYPLKDDDGQIVKATAAAVSTVLSNGRAQLATSPESSDQPEFRFPRPTSTKLKRMGAYPVHPGAALVYRSDKTRNSVAEDIRVALLSV
jgi:hypothetical protein